MQQQHLGLAAAGAPAPQAGREDARLVDHEHITGANVRYEVRELAVGPFPALAVDH